MSDDIERISAVAVSAPAGQYSHATAWNGLVFASGQLGARSDGSHTADQPFEIEGSPSAPQRIDRPRRGGLRSRADAARDGLHRRRRELARLQPGLRRSIPNTPVQQLGVIFAQLAQPFQPSPIWQWGRPTHRPFRGLPSVHSRCGLHTRAVTNS
jgi:hypothetical protein